MKKKMIIVFEIFVILVASIYYLVRVAIPEEKAKLGSSDYFIQTKNYQNLFEFHVDNIVHFGLVLNQNQEIYHIFFFDSNSGCLYNQNIEGDNIYNSLTKVVQILIQKDYLKKGSVIQVTRYGEEEYSSFRANLLSVLKKYDLNTDVLENESSLKQLSSSLGLEEKEDSSILRNIDFYSKNLVRDTDSKEMSDSNGLTEERAREFADSIYLKIETYCLEREIRNLEKNNTELIISYLSVANDRQTFYPSENSWYEVKDGKIYAYIEMETYGYCYKGSIDSVSKGEC